MVSGATCDIQYKSASGVAPTMDSRTTVVHQQDRAEEYTEIRDQFNEIFSLRKPKDAKAGFSSGAKSIGKGVIGGAVGLFAAPIVMAKEEGAKGFAKGVAMGTPASFAMNSAVHGR